MLEWLVSPLNGNFDMGVVPVDWLGAFIVPIHKGRATTMNVIIREVLVSCV